MLQQSNYIRAMQVFCNPYLSPYMVPFSFVSGFCISGMYYITHLRHVITCIGTPCSGLRFLLSHPVCTVCFLFPCLVPISFRSFSFFSYSHSRFFFHNASAFSSLPQLLFDVRVYRRVCCLSTVNRFSYSTSFFSAVERLWSVFCCCHKCDKV